MPTSHFKSKFDAISAVKDARPARFDSLTDFVKSLAFPGRLDIRATFTVPARNRYDTVRFGNTPNVFANRYNAASLKVGYVRNRLHILRQNDTKANFSNRFDIRTAWNEAVPCRWDALNDFPEKTARFSFTHDSCWAYLWRIGNRYQILSDTIARFCRTRESSKYNVFHPVNCIQNIRYDAIPQDYLAYFRNRFDIFAQYIAATPLHRQAFVKPGWTILAKNIATNEVQNLGFIDAEHENHAIEDIYLPDGDYEIQVLTSSLFWKDTFDSEIRMISIRPGEDISSLPTIYNLRSSVSQGETTIYWSSNRSDVSDCVFGVWYASASPVPADGPPTETVWYSSDMTEYQTSFTQTTPCYVAVAAMKPGDDLQMGKVHELFLDWKNTKPRYPDDVMVFDKPLPVYDPNILTIEQENPDLSLWS